jgi:hypothetical protein
MKTAHQGVPVQQLPGTDLIGYLLGPQQPVAQAQWPGGGGGQQANGGPGDQGALDWLYRNSGSPAPVQQAPPKKRERRGFFERLFGG